MTDQDNPYAAPQASALSRPLAADPGNARLRAEPAKLAAGRGAEWVSLSWQMFRKAPGVLVAMMLLYFVLAILAGMIPVIGDLFMSLAFGLWMAGWAITMDKLHRGADVSVGDLFAGFSSPRAGSLFAIGAIYLGLFVVAVVFVAVLAVVLLGVTSFEALSSLDLTGMALSIAFLVTLFLLLVFLLFAYQSAQPEWPEWRQSRQKAAWAHAPEPHASCHPATAVVTTISPAERCPMAMFPKPRCSCWGPADGRTTW